MEAESTNLTFYLPLFALIVVELTRIAREIDLSVVARQGHRPFLISWLFLLPINVLKDLSKILFDIIRIEIEGLYNLLNRPVKIVQIQVELFEFLTGVEPPEKAESWIAKTDKNIGKYYLMRIENIYDTTIYKIDSYESSLIGSMTKIESFFAPPLGRFALLHM